MRVLFPVHNALCYYLLPILSPPDGTGTPIINPPPPWQQSCNGEQPEMKMENKNNRKSLVKTSSKDGAVGPLCHLELQSGNLYR